MSPRLPPKSFPHHRQVHEFGCAPACLRMLAEWCTGARHAERRWQRIVGMRARGTQVSGVERGLIHLCELAPERVAAVEQLGATGWRRALERRPALPKRSVDLLFTDSYELDGGNVYHWMVLVGLQRSIDRERRLLAVLADPLADGLRCTPFDELARTTVRRVYRVTRR